MKNDNLKYFFEEMRREDKKIATPPFPKLDLGQPVERRNYSRILGIAASILIVLSLTLYGVIALNDSKNVNEVETKNNLIEETPPVYESSVDNWESPTQWLIDDF